ncbi:MAG: hypothetical protein FJ255_05955 [Phycisphaerae bacterium]|nr:hypothetical protein [Phycisphaerae bacterium]
MTKARTTSGVVLTAALVAMVAGSAVGASPPSKNLREYTVPGGATVRVWDQPGAGRLASFHRAGLPGFTEPAPSPTLLSTVYGDFDPTVARPVVAPGFEARAANDKRIVQFVVEPLPEMREALGALGVEVEGYLPYNAYVVTASAGQVAQMRAMPYVRWVGEYEPMYRVRPEVLSFYNAVIDGSTASLIVQGFSPDIKMDRFGQGLEWAFGVVVHRPGMRRAVVDAVRASGGKVFDYDPNADMTYIGVSVNKDQMRELAHMNEVAFIDPLGTMGHDMDVVRGFLGGANFIQAQAGGYTGAGVRGEVYDDGAQANHPEWNGQQLVHGLNGAGGHGSSCYGIVFANGVAAQARGMIPGASGKIIRAYQAAELNYATGLPTVSPRFVGVGELVNPAMTWRAVFQTSSVGSNRTASYTNISQCHDDMIFKHRLLMCQSQSNAGGTTQSRPEAWAKNMVAVGGVNHNNNSDPLTHTTSGASIGPAADSRVKPEVCHFYDNTYTTNSSSGYTIFGGTSGATPINAGHFGLFFGLWHNAHFTRVWNGTAFQNSGGGSDVFASRPAYTTARAVMINSAYRYQWVGGSAANAGLNRNWQGWGIANMTTLWNTRGSMFIENERAPIGSGETRTYQFDAPGGQSFFATMVYSDPAPLTLSIPNRVNNLNLKVTGPTGTVWWGNNGLAANNWNAVGGAANDRDTVENVFIQSLPAGRYTVEVSAASIVADGWLATPGMDANYALAVRGGTFVLPCCPGDWNCDGVIDFNDLLAFLNDYNAGLPIADLNGDGNVDFNDFLEFLNRYNTPCP